MAGLVGWWRGGSLATRARRSARAGLARLAGAPTTARRARLLVLLVIVAGPVMVLPGMWVHGALPSFPEQLLLIGAGIGVLALSQLAGLKVRVGSTTIILGFGEAALIVLLQMLPTGWVPLAVLIGALLAQVVQHLAGESRPAWVIAFNVSVLGVAGGCAAVLAAALAAPHGAPLTPRVTATLILSAFCYAAIALLIVTAVGSTRGGTRFRQLFPRAVTN